MSNGFIRSHTPKISALQRLMDAFLIIGSFHFIAWFYEVSLEKYQFGFAVIAALCFYVVGQGRGIYGSWRIGTIRSEIGEIILIWMVAFVLVLVMAFVTKTSANFSRRVVLTWLVLSPSMLAATRLSVRLALHELRRRGRNTRSVAIVGTSRVARHMVENINSMPWTGLLFKGYYDDIPVECYQRNLLLRWLETYQNYNLWHTQEQWMLCTLHYR